MIESRDRGNHTEYFRPDLTGHDVVDALTVLAFSPAWVNLGFRASDRSDQGETSSTVLNFERDKEVSLSISKHLTPDELDGLDFQSGIYIPQTAKVSLQSLYSYNHMRPLLPGLLEANYDLVTAEVELIRASSDSIDYTSGSVRFDFSPSHPARLQIGVLIGGGAYKEWFTGIPTTPAPSSPLRQTA